MFWEWLSINSWIFWLPALAIAIATVLILRKHRSRDLRSKITLKSIPRWAIFVMIPVACLAVMFFAEPMMFEIAREFLLPSERGQDWVEVPVFMQAFVFSLIGIPLILQGLAFGWLRRMFTSAVHCPKCHYDLASIIKRVGEPSTICPECGFQPSNGNPIGRPKRRRRLIIVGTLLILLGFFLSAYRLFELTPQGGLNWFVRQYTAITGRTDLFHKSPHILTKSMSLKLFNDYFQPVGNPPSLPALLARDPNLPWYFQSSRELDVAINSILPLYTTREFVPILQVLQRQLSDSRTRPNRSRDLQTSRLPLDDLLDQFLDASGYRRRNHDFQQIEATYLDPATPNFTKAAIICFALPDAPASCAIELLRHEADPDVQAMIMYSCNDLWHSANTSMFDRLYAANAGPEILRSLIIGMLTRGSRLSEWWRYTFFSTDVEDQFLDVLEADDSPLFMAPSLDAQTPDTALAWYKLQAFRVRALMGRSYSPLARARWQALINELNHLANQVESSRPSAPPVEAP